MTCWHWGSECKYERQNIRPIQVHGIIHHVRVLNSVIRKALQLVALSSLIYILDLDEGNNSICCQL